MSALLALTFLQTMTGQLAEIQILGWCWILINLFPGFTLLFISVLIDRHSAKLIPRFAHQTIVVLTTLYLITLLTTMLTEPLVTQGKLSMRDYRLNAYFWLVPYQAILLLGYILLFFKKKAIFKPDQSTIGLMSDKVAVKWAAINEKLRKECLQLLANGQLAKALKKLRENIEMTGVGDLEKIILLQNQYHENQKNQHLNLISLEEAQRVNSRITMAVMDIMKQNDYVNSFDEPKKLSTEEQKH